MAHKKTKTLKDYGSSVKKKTPCCGCAKVGLGPFEQYQRKLFILTTSILHFHCYPISGRAQL